MMPQTYQKGMKRFISYIIEASGRNRKACQAGQREQVKEAEFLLQVRGRLK